MTTETTPVQQIYLVKLKDRALQNVLRAHRTCAPRRRPPAVTTYPQIPHTKTCSIPVAPDSLQLHPIDSYKLRKQTSRSDGLTLLAAPHAREKAAQTCATPVTTPHSDHLTEKTTTPVARTLHATVNTHHSDLLTHSSTKTLIQR